MEYWRERSVRTLSTQLVSRASLTMGIGGLCQVGADATLQMRAKGNKTLDGHGLGLPIGSEVSEERGETTRVSRRLAIIENYGIYHQLDLRVHYNRHLRYHLSYDLRNFPIIIDLSSYHLLSTHFELLDLFFQVCDLGASRVHRNKYY